MDGTALTRLRIRVEGRVQGVGFRAFTRSEARRLNLAGWVRNLPDGSVELLAVVTPQSRQALLDALWQGPPGSHVTAVDVQTAGASGPPEQHPFQVLP